MEAGKIFLGISVAFLFLSYEIERNLEKTENKNLNFDFHYLFILEISLSLSWSLSTFSHFFKIQQNTSCIKQKKSDLITLNTEERNPQRMCIAKKTNNQAM